MKLGKEMCSYLHQKRFRMDFPGRNSCLTGLGFASLMGVNPWESRQELHTRLNKRQEPVIFTPEMRRTTVYRWWAIDVFEKTSPSKACRFNPFFKHRDGSYRLFVSDITHPGISGQIDAFMVSKDKDTLTAGLTIRTAGMSQRDQWEMRPARPYATQALCLSGLCGGIDWIIATVMCSYNYRNSVEDIPVEIRCYHLKFNKDVYNMIYQEAVRYWEDDYTQENIPENYKSDEYLDIIDNYIAKDTRRFRTLNSEHIKNAVNVAK